MGLMAKYSVCGIKQVSQLFFQMSAKVYYLLGQIEEETGLFWRVKLREAQDVITPKSTWL